MLQATRLYRRRRQWHPALLGFIQHRDPAIEQRAVVELVEDGEHGAGGGEYRTHSVASAAEELECFLVQQPALARRELRLARRRPVKRPGTTGADLGGQLLDPAR